MSVSCTLFSRLTPLVWALVFAVGLTACQQDESQPEETGPEAPAEKAEEQPAAGPAEGDAEGQAVTERSSEPPASAPSVKVTGVDYAFEAPDEIPSGWTTFEFENAGEQEHFLVLWRLPEGKTFEDYQEEVVSAFRESMEEYRAGDVDRDGMFEALGERLPEWFATVEAAGGPGLTAPGLTSQTTVNLEPGEYVMECYVKTPEGNFHGFLGMLEPLTVTDESTGQEEPEADMELTLSNYDVAMDGELSAGSQTIRVRYADDPEGLLSHDIHLARLAEDDDLDEVVAWMDWVDELRAPAPAEFLGGAEQMPGGSTAYVTVDLEPGRYAWISEEYGNRGVVKEFAVE